MQLVYMKVLPLLPMKVICFGRPCFARSNFQQWCNLLKSPKKPACLQGTYRVLSSAIFSRGRRSTRCSSSEICANTLWRTCRRKSFRSNFTSNKLKKMVSIEIVRLFLELCWQESDNFSQITAIQRFCKQSAQFFFRNGNFFGKLLLAYNLQWSHLAGPLQQESTGPLVEQLMCCLMEVIVDVPVL